MQRSHTDDLEEQDQAEEEALHIAELREKRKQGILIWHDKLRFIEVLQTHPEFFRKRFQQLRKTKWKPHYLQLALRSDMSSVINTKRCFARKKPKWSFSKGRPLANHGCYEIYIGMRLGIVGNLGQFHGADPKKTVAKLEAFYNCMQAAGNPEYAKLSKHEKVLYSLETDSSQLMPRFNEQNPCSAELGDLESEISDEEEKRLLPMMKAIYRYQHEKMADKNSAWYHCQRQYKASIEAGIDYGHSSIEAKTARAVHMNCLGPRVCKEPWSDLAESCKEDPRNESACKSAYEKVVNCWLMESTQRYEETEQICRQIIKDEAKNV
eukprot:TRINITY_DN8769_c0_g1_i1.p1 TRINITY_DN8769_c0_g1~~TRINITY_DN8769_c0_g1_i1.p1  ORF type:complete len:323 (+),score=45.93 TRINITY_DN8769_c0_g1_i1:160-1128(+)